MRYILEINVPYTLRKIMTMKQLVDSLDEQELMFEGNGETSYKS